MVEIAERKQAEEALRLNERRLEALLNLNQVQWTSDKEIARYVLEQELKLTRSETGAIGFLDEEEKVIKWCAGISTLWGHGLHQNRGSRHRGDAIKTRQPVVANEIPGPRGRRQGTAVFARSFSRVYVHSVCDGE